MNSRETHILSYSKLIPKTFANDPNADSSYINPRWFLLILISITCLNDSLTYSVLPSLQDNILSLLNLPSDAFQTLQQTTFGLLAFTPLIIGFAIDYYDLDPSYHLLAGSLVLGQGFQALGGGISCWPLIFIGKVFGTIAIAALTVIKAVILAKWFTGKQLSLAFGTCFAASEVGRLMGKYLAQGIFKWCQKLYMPLLLGVFFTIISWITVILILRINRKTDRQGPGDRDTTRRSLGALLRSLKVVKASYILVVLGILCFTGAYYGFSYNPADLLTERFGFSETKAASTMNIYTIFFPAIVAPLTGYFIDQIGMRSRILGISFICLTVCASIWIGIPRDTPSFIVILVCFMVGILYGIFQGILWPCVALTTDEKMIGIGYGIAYSFVNFILWVWYQIGLLSGPKRLANNVIVIVTGLVGIGLMYWLYKVDERENQGRLERQGSGALDQRMYKSPIYF